MTPPALPGTTRALLAIGMVVWQEGPALHGEVDPDLWHLRGGIVWSIGDGWVGTVTANRFAPGGVQEDRFEVDTIHDCDRPACIYRPQPGRPADRLWIARRLWRLVQQGTGPLTATEEHWVAIGATLRLGAP